MAKPIQIGPHSFRSQKDALAHIASIRDRYSNGEPITEPDTEFLHDLLLLHPYAAQKVGAGVAGFTVGTEQVYKKTRHFIVRRTDGSVTDFSFHTCVKGSDERRDRLQALRVAVAGQVETFKTTAFAGRTEVPCAVRGTLTNFANADVDHEPPSTFSKLVEDWLAKEGLALDDVRVSGAEDNQIVSTMSDSKQRTSWQEFHRQHARLRITCRQANLSDVRTGIRRTRA